MTLVTTSPFFTAPTWGPARTTPTFTGLVITPASTSVRLSWNFTEDVSYYEIVRNGTTVATLDGGIIAYTDAGLSTVTLYTYSVIAHFTVGADQTQGGRVRTLHQSAPEIVFTETYNMGMANSFTIPIPTGLQTGDVLIVQAVHGNNTQVLPFSIPGWTQGTQANSAETGANQMYYARMTPGFTPTPFTATYTNSTANSVLRMIVVRGANQPRSTNVYSEPFNFILPNSFTTTAYAAGTTIAPWTPEPINGFGTMLSLQNFLSTAAVDLNVTPLSNQTVHDSNVTSTVHPVVAVKTAQSINDSLTNNFSLNSAAQRSEILLWIPGADTTGIYRIQGAGSQSGTATTSVTVGVTGNLVETDDSVLFFVQFGSVAGAVTATAPAGWSAPTRVIDTVQTVSTHRFVLFHSRPTAVPAEGQNSFTITIPSVTANQQGAWIVKNTGAITPTSVSKVVTTTNDTLSTTVSDKAFNLGFITGSGAFVGSDFTRPTDFSRTEWNVSRGENSTFRITGAGFGVIAMPGEKTAAGNVDFAVNIGGGPTPTARHVVSFVGSNLTFASQPWTGVPRNLTVTSSSASLFVQWEANEEASSFVVRRNGVVVYSGPRIDGNGWHDTGLTNGTSYSYTVSAVISGVETAQSAAVSGTPRAVTVTVGALNPTAAQFIVGGTGMTVTSWSIAGRGSGTLTAGSVLVLYLEPDTDYTFNLVLSDAAGATVLMPQTIKTPPSRIPQTVAATSLLSPSVVSYTHTLPPFQPFDIVVINTGIKAARIPAVPAGWTSPLSNSGTASGTYFFMWRRMQPGDPTTVVLNQGGTAAAPIAVVTNVYRGVDVGDNTQGSQGIRTSSGIGTQTTGATVNYWNIGGNSPACKMVWNATYSHTVAQVMNFGVRPGWTTNTYPAINTNDTMIVWTQEMDWTPDMGEVLGPPQHPTVGTTWIGLGCTYMVDAPRVPSVAGHNTLTTGAAAGTSTSTAASGAALPLPGSACLIEFTLSGMATDGPFSIAAAGTTATQSSWSAPVLVYDSGAGTQVRTLIYSSKFPEGGQASLFPQWTLTHPSASSRVAIVHFVDGIESHIPEVSLASRGNGVNSLTVNYTDDKDMWYYSPITVNMGAATGMPEAGINIPANFSRSSGFARSTAGAGANAWIASAGATANNAAIVNAQGHNPGTAEPTPRTYTVTDTSGTRLNAIGLVGFKAKTLGPLAVAPRVASFAAFGIPL